MTHLPQGAPLWNHGNQSPRYFETMHRLIQRGIVFINLNLRSLFHFIPLSMYVLSLSSRDTQRRIP